MRPRRLGPQSRQRRLHQFQEPLLAHGQRPAGELIALRPTSQDGVFAVYFCAHRIGAVDLNQTDPETCGLVDAAARRPGSTGATTAANRIPEMKNVSTMSPNARPRCLRSKQPRHGGGGSGSPEIFAGAPIQASEGNVLRQRCDARGFTPLQLKSLRDEGSRRPLSHRNCCRWDPTGPGYIEIVTRSGPQFARAMSCLATKWMKSDRQSVRGFLYRWRRASQGDAHWHRH